MKLDTRTYTNLILTIIAALLLVLVLRPQLSVVGDAYARNEQQREKQMSVNVQGNIEVQAQATREVAAANNNIAKAIDRLAQTTDRIASQLGNIASK